MKVILSRKGFDSSSGGYPSLIFPDNSMQSLPIPSDIDTIRYSEVTSTYQSKNLYDVMKKINSQIKNRKWIDLDPEATCHLDPDISRNAIARESDVWRGCFGQGQAAQALLDKYNVGEGDLFLFFGWFKHCAVGADETLHLEKGDGKHVLFGYLQVDSVYHTLIETPPEWLKYHPHMIETRTKRKNNCIYVAKDTLTWDKSTPGYGTFVYDKDLDLTKPGYSRSKWELPEIFKNASISYHTKDSWKDNYFQSAHRGQEFIVEDNAAVEAWAMDIIERHSSYGKV